MIIDLYSGIFVPIPTPFSIDDLSINFEYVRKHVEFLNNKGVNGIVVAGMEGEFPSLSIEERKNLITWVMKFRGNLKIIIQTGSTSLVETIELSQFAEDHGADGLLISLPYYYKNISEQGFVNYFYEIFKRVECPIFLYNIPEMTSFEAITKVISQLIDFPYLTGLNDSSDDWDSCKEFITYFSKLHIFITNDLWIKSGIESGAGGAITVIGNMFPELIVGIYNSIQQQIDATYLQERLTECRKLFNQFPLQAAIKHTLHLIGFEQCSVRPPLVNLTIAQKKELEKKLVELEFYD